MLKSRRISRSVDSASHAVQRACGPGCVTCDAPSVYVRASQTRTRQLLAFLVFRRFYRCTVCGSSFTSFMTPRLIWRWIREGVSVVRMQRFIRRILSANGPAFAIGTTCVAGAAYEIADENIATAGLFLIGSYLLFRSIAQQSESRSRITE